MRAIGATNCCHRIVWVCICVRAHRDNAAPSCLLALQRRLVVQTDDVCIFDDLMHL